VIRAGATGSGDGPRLHFGCGTCGAQRWVNVDLRPAGGVDVVADICDGLPFPDDRFRYIVSIHALVELPYVSVVPALRELSRVLRTGGVLRLGLPDLDRAIDAYRSGDVSYFCISDDEMPLIDGKFVAQLTWYGTNRMLFTTALATELLWRAGFRKVRPTTYRRTTSVYAEITDLDSRPRESLFVEGWK
jgi:SAM-dependent methyltransferase